MLIYHVYQSDYQCVTADYIPYQKYYIRYHISYQHGMLMSDTIWYITHFTPHQNHKTRQTNCKQNLAISKTIH